MVNLLINAQSFSPRRNKWLSLHQSNSKQRAMSDQHTYIAIDLKSFYASVECIERGLNPLDTNLVVADSSRTDKTICLAVSPPLKAYGTGGRPRLFEVRNKISEINSQKANAQLHGCLPKKSFSAKELYEHPQMLVDFIIATPRMALYIDYSSRIYNVYLKYIAPEDIHIYSIDEVFIDATTYLKLYKLTPRDLATKIIKDILDTTGITATAGIGTNLYLCKVAMDIVAKHAPADEYGVRIAELNEMTYRQTLWSHKPLTDFWRVGHGVAQRLKSYGIDTMGKIARCSVNNEEILYGLFGTNAELLIDHAWGWEPCTIPMIKAYKPQTNSISNGQVLPCPYNWHEAEIVTREMAENLSLELASKRIATDQIVLSIGYQTTHDDIDNNYFHTTANLTEYSSSTNVITSTTIKLYNKLVNRDRLIRRLNITLNHVIPEQTVRRNVNIVAPSLFDEPVDNKNTAKAKQENTNEKEKKIQDAIIHIKNKFGKNSILKGTNYEKGATAKERNKQIGGHKA